jgi:RimJ/RimL family protein N-acetyltransferase
MHADEEVSADLGGPLDRPTSDSKFDRYRKSFIETGVSRWAVEDHRGYFLGYSGVMLRGDPAHPLGVHYEIGCRFLRRAWGKGYASESAQAALSDALNRSDIREILSYTSAENIRSQAVMRRLNLKRDMSRDFSALYDGVGLWRGLVWTTKSAPPMSD